MAKTKISEYNSSANSNTDIASINIDEGCAPSGINNAIRTLMAHLKDWQAGLSGDFLPVASGGTGAAGGTDALVNIGERTAGTGSLKLPVGTTAQRDGTPAAGYFRYNTTNAAFEGYNGSAWAGVGGASGGGGNPFVYENDSIVSVSYTLTSGKNGISAGPITVNSGVTVTVPSGSIWVVV